MDDGTVRWTRLHTPWEFRLGLVRCETCDDIQAHERDVSSPTLLCSGCGEKVDFIQAMLKSKEIGD